MNSKNERRATEREDWIEWSNVSSITDTDPETEEIWRQAVQDGASVFGNPDPIDHNEPGNWFLAGYDSPCEYGDQIQDGDTIRADGFGGWEHRDCVESGQPMYEGRPEHETTEPEWTI